MDPMYLSTVPSSGELINPSSELINPSSELITPSSEFIIPPREKPLDPRNPMYLPIDEMGQELKTSSFVKPVNPFTSPSRKRSLPVPDGS